MQDVARPTRIAVEPSAAPADRPAHPQALGGDLGPLGPSCRQPAYEAVYAILRRTPPGSADSYGGAAENARVWRAVEAALDAMGVPK